MESNLLLWAITVVIYGAVVLPLQHWFAIKQLTLKAALRTVLIVAVLTMPFNLNGHIFTVFGNVVGKNEHVWALASLYQKTNGFSFTLLAPFSVQLSSGNEGDAFAGIGIPLIQDGNHVALAVGVAPYQSSRRTATVVLGISGAQFSDRYAYTIAALNFYQRAGVQASTFFSFRQRVGDKIRDFAVMSKLGFDSTGRSLKSAPEPQ